MSAFGPQLVRALARGVAVETGREAARRNNILGFLQWDDDDDSGPDFYPYESGGGNDWGGYFFDDYGNYYEYDWFNVGGPTDYYQALDYGFWDVDDGSSITTYFTNESAFNPPSTNSGVQDLLDWWTALTSERANNDPYSDLQDTLDWWTQLTGVPEYGPAGTGQGLPKPCYGATYHPYPIGHPQQDLCEPYPDNNTAAKKQAAQQKKTQQAAANAMKAAQKKQDQACPKHPQGLPVWKNPQTGKCEVVPQCPQGSKFDSATRRCLTPAQVKELYGDNSWIWWLVGGGVALMIVTRDSGGRRR